MTQIIYAAINWLARYPHGRVGVLVLNLSGKANGAQTPREKFALDRAFALIDGHPEESKSRFQENHLVMLLGFWHN